MYKSLNSLSGGDCVVIAGAPYLVLSATHLHMQQRKANVRLRVKNLRTGQVLEKTYRSDEELEEADLERISAVFLYVHRGEYWFAREGDPKQRFSLDEATIGEIKKFLKKDIEIVALLHNKEVVHIKLPIKAEYNVVEAPPVVRGNTAQGGTKQVTIESGAKITVPMFISQNDIIRVNTETGEYVERVEKGA